VVLDYSGHLLNLASRLTDLARPRGIVLDGAFGLDLLTDQQQGLFEEQEVYLPSVAEESPRRVYILSGVVELAEAAHRPVRLERWERVREEKTLRQWGLAAPRFGIDLPKTLKRSDGIQVEMGFPAFRAGRRVPGLRHYLPAPFDYRLQANRAMVVVRVDEMLASVRALGASARARVAIVIDNVPE